MERLLQLTEEGDGTINGHEPTHLIGTCTHVDCLSLCLSTTDNEDEVILGELTLTDLLVHRLV